MYVYDEANTMRNVSNIYTYFDLFVKAYICRVCIMHIRIETRVRCVLVSHIFANEIYICVSFVAIFLKKSNLYDKTLRRFAACSHLMTKALLYLKYFYRRTKHTYTSIYVYNIYTRI